MLAVVAGLAACGSGDTFTCDVYFGTATKFAPDTKTDENENTAAEAVKACESDMALQMEAQRANGSNAVTCTCTGS